MYAGKEFVVCCREVHKTMADSLHKLICDKVDALGLRPYFKITDTEVKVPHNGSQAIFKGLGANVKENVKSIEGSTICLVEEADDVTEYSWDILIPTVVRTPNAEIWVAFNTGLLTDPTYVMFVTNEDPERMDVRKVSYRDNPFNEAGVLEEMEKMKEKDYDKYLHIWEGEPIAAKDGNVFKVDQMKIVQAVPAGCRWVRGWDFASSAEPDERTKKTPDFTVGLKLGYNPDTERYIIGDVKRFQGTPDEVEATLITTTANDGLDVAQDLPTDPGQAGKFQVQYLIKKLSGFRVHTSLESGDKITRAEPAASQANVGNVDVLQAHWTEPLLNELRSFCGDPRLKDDQVDALSRAFARLSQPQYMTRIKIF